MENRKIRSISIDEYIFSETDKNNQFYFYRKDGNLLDDVDSLPMNMLQRYLCMCVMEGQKDILNMKNIVFQTSCDHKCVRITLLGMGEKITDFRTITRKKSAEETKVKRLVKSIFHLH